MATSFSHKHGLLQGRSRILLAIVLLVSCQSALALGIGEPQLLSRYAEPLRVRVPLVLGSADERNAAGAVQAEVVPESDYPKYGVAEQGIDLSDIYTVRRDADPWIEIGSHRPMREPAAILLLRVRLGNTLVVKEVPLLFDLNPAGPAETAVADAVAPTDDAASTRTTDAPAVAAMTDVADAVDAMRPAAPVAARKSHRARHLAVTAAVAAAPPPAAAPLFQLSQRLGGYTSAGTSTSLKLTERFDSLAEWLRRNPQAAALAVVPSAAAGGAQAPQALNPVAAALAKEPAFRPRWISRVAAAGAFGAALWLW